MIPKLVTIVALGVVVSAPWTVLGQNRQAGLPAVFKNLRVLDKNISQKDLKATMEGFTDQLGVKCTYCHILDEYEKDEFQHKRDARRMILLLQTMRAGKAKFFKDGVKDSQINCGICHRGKPEPEEFVP